MAVPVFKALPDATYCNLNKQRSCSIPAVCFRGMRARSALPNLFLFVISSQPQSKVYSDTSSPECESVCGPVGGSERLPTFPTSPQVAIRCQSPVIACTYFWKNLLADDKLLHFLVDHPLICH